MKMASALPDPQSKKNGMDQVRELMMRYPDRPVLAVVSLDCASLNVDYRKGGARTPTVGILHIEPMVEVSEHSRAESLLRAAYLRRTSEQLELPLDFNVLGAHRMSTDFSDTLPKSRWRAIDSGGNVAADVTPEPPDDPDEGETGPPEADMDVKED